MKLKNIFFTLFFLCAFVLPSEGQSHFIKAKEDSLLSLLEQNNKAMGSLAVMDKGKIIYARAIGHAGITPEKKVSDEKTRYRIGSISKMFTATLVFQLIEENKLELSATLDKFFPSVRNAEKITIGNLMNHRSGIHNFTNDAAYNTYMTKMKTKSEMITAIPIMCCWVILLKTFGKSLTRMCFKNISVPGQVCLTRITEATPIYQRMKVIPSGTSKDGSDSQKQI
jgi:D-alanyl-D-alanine carboxypeptidase